MGLTHGARVGDRACGSQGDRKVESELERGDWQIPAEALPPHVWDVVIAGAGPAGGMAAYHLAARGHRVLLLDRDRFPRHKTCGDTLIADTLRCLQRAGLEEPVRRAGHEVRLLSVFSPRRDVLDVPGTFVMLPRRTLDALVTRHAVQAGAVFAHGAVARLTREDDGTVACAVAGCERPVHARVGIVATGARLGLLQRLGMARAEKPSGVGMRQYVRSRVVLDRLVIVYDRTTAPGYAWILPEGDGLYNIGCGIACDRRPADFNLRDVFSVFIREFPLAREVMRQSEPLTPLSGAVVRCGLNGRQPVVAGGILAVGEAIHSSLPFTGEGIGRAMETGELAAAVIHEALAAGDLSRLAQYADRLDRELRPRYRGYPRAQRWISSPWRVDMFVRRARRSRFLRDSLAAMFEDRMAPHAAFSLWGVFQSLWR